MRRKESQLRPRSREWRIDAGRILAAEFEREALGAEGLRVLFLARVITVSLLLSLIPPTFFSEGIGHVFRVETLSFVFWLFSILSILALYVLGERILLGRVFVCPAFENFTHLRGVCTRW